jgi:hypothetical protein
VDLSTLRIVDEALGDLTGEIGLFIPDAAHAGDRRPRAASNLQGDPLAAPPIVSGAYFG